MKNQLIIPGGILITFLYITGCTQNNSNSATTSPVEISNPIATSTPISQSSPITTEKPPITKQSPTTQKLASGTYGNLSNDGNDDSANNDNPAIKPVRIKFDRGSTSTIIKNAVVRGTRDSYLLRARKGQQMNLKITSLENNAVFDVISSNGKTLQREATKWRLSNCGRGNSW